jgi:hypothetical protein
MSFGIIAGATVGLIGSSMSADAAKAGSDNAAAAQKAQLEFDMQRYNDWKDIYGPLQEDLGEHYKNLTGETLVGPELEALQKAQQESEEKIRASMAQRGLGGGGLESQLISDTIYNVETQKALSRTTADQRAADAKQNFLNIGLGQGSTIAGQMHNSTNNLATTQVNAGNTQANLIKSGADTLSGIIGYADATGEF